MLYTTPKSLYISDITTSTKVGEDLSAEFSFDVEYHLENQEKEDVQCNIQLLDGAEDRVVAESFSCRDTRRLAAPQLWWPHLMSEQPGHMYQLRVSVISVKHGMDEYSLGVGLRQTCQRCSMMFRHGEHRTIVLSIPNIFKHHLHVWAQGGVLVQLQPPYQ